MRRGYQAAYRAVTLLVLGLMTGCYSFPQNNGYYLAEGTSEEIGVYLEEVRIFIPGPGGPTYLDTNRFVGGLYLFPPGDPFAVKHFTFPESVYAIDGSFSVTAPNDSDPSETVQLTGKCTDPNGDGAPDNIVGTVVLPDGARSLTIDRVAQRDYDHYKCWDGPGTCPIAVSTASCTFTPLGDGSYALTAEFPFKQGDGNLAGGGAAIMEVAPGMIEPCPSGPLPGPGLCDWGTGEFPYTTTVSGVTEGTVGYQVPQVFFLPDPVWTGVGFRISNAPNTANVDNACLFP